MRIMRTCGVIRRFDEFVFTCGCPRRDVMKDRYVAVGVVCMIQLYLFVLPSWAFVAGGFIENRGQVDPAVKYHVLCSRASVHFTENAVVLGSKKEIAGLSFGVDPRPRPADRWMREDRDPYHSGD